MQVLIACTTCWRTLQVADTYVGKKVKCPLCQATFIASPAEEPAADEGTDPEPPLEPDWVEPVDDEPLNVLPAVKQPAIPRLPVAKKAPKGGARREATRPNERPAYLLLFALLPLGMPFLARLIPSSLPGAIPLWGGVALLLTAMCLVLMVLSSIPEVYRAAGCLGLTMLGYVGLLAATAAHPAHRPFAARPGWPIPPPHARRRAMPELVPPPAPIPLPPIAAPNEEPPPAPMPPRPVVPAPAPEEPKLSEADLDAARVAAQHLRPRGTITEGSEIISLAIAPDGRSFATATGTPPDFTVPGEVKVWQLGLPRSRQNITGNGPVTFLKNGSRLLFLEGPGRLRVWDLRTGETLPDVLPATAGTRLHGTFAVSPDGRHVLTCDRLALHRIELPSFREEAVFAKLNADLNALAWAPDSLTFAAAANRDRAAKLYDAATGQLRQTLTGHTRDISALAFSPDGKRLASAGLDGAIRLWDVETGQTQAVLPGHADGAWHVTWHADGRLLASTGADNCLRLWDTSNDKLWALVRLNGGRGNHTQTAFTPDGRMLLVAHAKQVLSWEVTAGLPK